MSVSICLPAVHGSPFVYCMHTCTCTFVLNPSFLSCQEEHFSTLIYQIPTVDGHSLSQLFETMELGRTNLEILDYSVSQTTLDDVFIHFANQQSDGVPSSDGDDVAKGDLHGDGSDIAKEDLNGDVAQKDLRSDDTGLTGTKTEELKAKVNDGVKYTVANEGTTEVA